MGDMGSFTRAALPNMSRDNSERRVALPNFMSRDNSARQAVAGNRTPRGQHVPNKGTNLQDDLFFQEEPNMMPNLAKRAKYGNQPQDIP